MTYYIICIFKYPITVKYLLYCDVLWSYRPVLITINNIFKNHLKQTTKISSKTNQQHTSCYKHERLFTPSRFCLLFWSFFSHSHQLCVIFHGLHFGILLLAFCLVFFFSQCLSLVMMVIKFWKIL